MVPEESAGDYWKVKKLFFEGMNLGEQDVLLFRSGGWLGRAQQLQLSESFSKLRLKTIKEITSITTIGITRRIGKKTSWSSAVLVFPAATAAF